MPATHRRPPRLEFISRNRRDQWRLARIGDQRQRGARGGAAHLFARFAHRRQADAAVAGQRQIAHEILRASPWPLSTIDTVARDTPSFWAIMAEVMGRRGMRIRWTFHEKRKELPVASTAACHTPCECRTSAILSATAAAHHEPVAPAHAQEATMDEVAGRIRYFVLLR